MITIRPRPAPCIFCSFRFAAGSSFSTSTPKARLSSKGANKGKREHAERQRIKIRRTDKGFSSGPYDGISFRPLLRTTSANGAQGNGSKSGRSSLAFKSPEDRIRICLKNVHDRVRQKGLKADDRLRHLDIPEHQLALEFKRFSTKLSKAIKHLTTGSSNYVADRLMFLADKRPVNVAGLENEVMNAFIGDVTEGRIPKSSVEGHWQFSDLRYPPEWYPATRAFKRTFHLHIGPTNSGKTYQALKRLEEAESGMYAGPLRLLAFEIYNRLNARGKRCALITGDDKRAADDTGEPVKMVSCTVEMTNISRKMDVAVIDEIQLLGDEERGWAWTNAVLGVQAREVHLCGEARTEPIVREIVGMCGDELHVHNYERLSPLQMMPESLAGDLTSLRAGDCVVAFSVQTIHALRYDIEKRLGVKVAIVYGGLPPETRARQAELFNDPESGYDILVASNAVGMGLNLSIKRMIFESSVKHIGAQRVGLQIPEIKQIAGRAGRFRTSSQETNKSLVRVSSPVEPPKDPGLVTTLDNIDYDAIAHAMSTEPKPIESAGIFPPAFMVERFARYFPPETPFSQIFLRLCTMASVQDRFHISSVKKICGIADAIESVKGLQISDRLIICNAPIEPRKDKEPELACELAMLIMEKRPSSVLDIENLDLELLTNDYKPSREYLRQVETLHKGLMIYTWLSYRFTDIFTDPHIGQRAKDLTEERIAKVLEQLSAAGDIKVKKATPKQTVASKPGESFLSDVRSLASAADKQDSAHILRVAQDLSEVSSARIVEFHEQLARLNQHAAAHRSKRVKSLVLPEDVPAQQIEAAK